MDKKNIPIILIVLIILSIAAYKLIFESKDSTESNVPTESNDFDEYVHTESNVPTETSEYFTTEFIKAPVGFNQFVKTFESFHFDKVLEESIATSNQKSEIEKNIEIVKAIIMANLFNIYRLSDIKGEFEYEKDLGDPKLLDEDAKRINKLKETILKIIEFDNENQFMDKKILDLLNFGVVRFNNFQLANLPKSEILNFFPRLYILDLTCVGHSTGFEILKDAKNLYNLNLSENNIIVFPNFSEFEVLRTVDLSNNKIKEINLDSYIFSSTPSISKYNTSDIRNLNLCSNPIKRVDKNIFKVFQKLFSFYVTKGRKIICEDTKFKSKIVYLNLTTNPSASS